MGVRWAQLEAVVRLEIKKTFFAKRGLWIYLVALLPILLFTAFAIATAHQRNQSADFAQRSEKSLTEQDLQAVKVGMTSDEVTARLGRPPSVAHWVESRRGESGLSVGIISTSIKLEAVGSLEMKFLSTSSS